MKLQDTIALVTGANQGLGKCYTEEMLRRGAAKIYACGLTLESLEPLTEAHGERIVPLKLDVTNRADIAAAVDRARDLTVLFNNAGVLAGTGLMEAGSCASFRHEMDVNVFGLADMSLSFAPVIEGNGGGAIINMLSVASLANFPPFGTYCATKAAAMSITNCLRYELKDKGIGVYGIYAGLIDTPLIRDFKGEKSKPEDIAAIAMAAVEDGVADIDTDARARDVRHLLGGDPGPLQRIQHEKADAFLEMQG